MLLRLTVALSLLLFCSWGTACAEGDRPIVAYTGVYLMGNAEAKFPVYSRNKDAMRDALGIEMAKVAEQGTLPFDLLFNTDSETTKRLIDNTLSLALVIVRDDVAAESFSAAGTTINKTVINVGLTAVLYDTRKVDGRNRNTVIFSFPLLGYSQRLDGDKRCSQAEIDSLFVKSAATTLRENLIKRLAGVSLSEIEGEVTSVSAGNAQVNIGSNKGVEEGQYVAFWSAGKKLARGPVVKLERDAAVVELPKGFQAGAGLRVRASNMRAVSDETFQVVEAKVTSKKAAQVFQPEVIGPQAAQWFSNFLTERGGKVVLPSRVGGQWDENATGTAFTLVDRAGMEHQFQLPPPKHPVSLEITGVSSKVTQSNDVNDICMFKVWMKVKVPSMKYEKEFESFSSKSLVKGVQSFEEKNEFFDLLYQVTAKIAREAHL